MAKMRFVTLVSTIAYKIVMVTNKSLSWGSTMHTMEPFFLPGCRHSYSGCCSYRLSLEHSLALLEASLRKSGEKSPCINYGAKSLPPSVFGKLSLST